MKTFFQYKRIYLLGLTPISLLLTWIAKNNNHFAEQVFALRIYRWLSQLISVITGIFPFSIAEFMILMLPIVILILGVRFVLGVIKDKENRKTRLIKGAWNILGIVSVVFFLFTILTGINYHRYTFTYYSKLELRDSSLEELYELTEYLVDQANELRAEVPSTDEHGVFRLSMSNSELRRAYNRTFHKLANDYPVLGGRYGAPKPILLSSIMTYTEITGIFIPFTMEANVNVHVPDYNIPATAMHEMAHQRGFMREDEANFIAYIAGINSDYVDLQYSSAMMALVYAGNALYSQSPDLYFELRNQYSEGVLNDIRASAAFWARYEDNVVSTVSNKINDTYLKANAQEDGVKSYGRMVDLLLAQYRSGSKTD